MSRKSYKQIQNRLYREIKRRIIAEQNIHNASFKNDTRDRKIDRVCLRKGISLRCICNACIFDGREKYEEEIKRQMAYEIADKLLEDGYIVFYCNEQKDPELFVRDLEELMAEIEVLKPREV